MSKARRLRRAQSVPKSDDPYHKTRCSGGPRTGARIQLDTGSYCLNCGTRMTRQQKTVISWGHRYTVLVWMHDPDVEYFSTTNGC